jgi:predicted aconitase
MPPFLNAIIDWLRAGYPDGVPESDYIPLLALLRRRLSADEVRQIAAELAAAGDIPADKTDIQVMITRVTNEMPSETDTSRVQARLEAHAWPDPESDQ